MTKYGTTISIAWLLVALFCGGALADDTGAFQPPIYGPPPQGAFDHPPPPPLHACHLLAMALHEGAVLEVLTELTGESAETIQAAMEEEDMRQILTSYGIEEEAFRSAMDAKMNALVNQAAQCGLITTDKAQEIIESMESHSDSSGGNRPGF
jgi:hypothetical protein